MSPRAKVVVRVSARDHLSMHVTAEAQLNPDSVLLNGLFELILDMYDMTQPVRLPGQECLQLQIRCRIFALGEVQRDLQPGSLCPSEAVAEYANVTFGWVAAEVDTDNACGLILDGEIDDFFRICDVVATVD